MQTRNSSAKVVLLAQAREASVARGNATPIRRYRIARLPLGGAVTPIRRNQVPRAA